MPKSPSPESRSVFGLTCRRAFTGAGNKGKSGYFEMADGGTVFLDEIGELSLAMQTRLLRVLQDGEIMRVGSSKPARSTSASSPPRTATLRNASKRAFSGAIFTIASTWP